MSYTYLLEAGGIYGGILLGHETVCAVEIEPKNREILLQRQRDGWMPRFPIWDDVRTFDGKPWCGQIDIICGGFPCQDISAAGKGAGISGAKSGLWSEFARIIGEVRPKYAFIENSPMLVTRGLDRVLADLAALGYDAEWCCLSAGDCGAWHERDRIWILAADREYDGARRWKQQQEGEQKENAATDYQSAGLTSCDDKAYRSKIKPLGVKSWGGFSGIDGIEKVVAKFCRMVYGLADRKHRIFAIGNGQVPRVAATAFTILKKRLET